MGDNNNNNGNAWIGWNENGAPTTTKNALNARLNNTLPAPPNNNGNTLPAPPNNNGNTLPAPPNNNEEVIPPVRRNKNTLKKPKHQTKITNHFTRKAKTHNISKSKKWAKKLGRNIPKNYNKFLNLGSRAPKKPKNRLTRRNELIREKEAAADAADALILPQLQAEAEERAARRRAEGVM